MSATVTRLNSRMAGIVSAWRRWWYSPLYASLSSALLTWLFLVGGVTRCFQFPRSLPRFRRWRDVALWFACQFAKRTPRGRQRIANEQDAARHAIQKDVTAATAHEAVHTKLPDEGVPREQLLTTLERWSASEKRRWSAGQASGSVYHGGADLSIICSRAFALFAWSNPLHPTLFPYVRKMEAEVVQMLLDMFHADDATTALSAPCGTMTSGGTESILLACKAYRDRAYDQRGLVDGLEIVAPVTIHAAFEKAAHYFNLRLVHVDVDPITMMCSVDAVKRAVTRRTILIAASAPCFSVGVIDPIEDLAEFARQRGIGFHSDCCLGGLLLPFVETLQQSGRIQGTLPRYDFRARGVTSISADTVCLIVYAVINAQCVDCDWDVTFQHKYGYAPKGTSVIMYRNEELRHYQYFVSVRWTGGIYASPTLAGSRPGALSAATWSAMMSMGRNGYLDAAKDIMEASQVIRQGITKIKGLRIMGDSMLSVVAFGCSPIDRALQDETAGEYSFDQQESCHNKGYVNDSEDLNIYKIDQALSERGWSLSKLQYPNCLHICCTYLHRGERAQQFLADLRAAVKEVQIHPERFAEGSAAIYGMSQRIPDSTLIEPLAKSFVDALFMP